MRFQGLRARVQGDQVCPAPPVCASPSAFGEPVHKRPYVGVSQGTVLGFGDGFGAILWETVAKS